ncbi:hypothetical protein ZHAS_00013946 [Anopheles sinensis]|uniref:Uncharacterized protein n=1 Tax=Anopheles sinensis TaxID=74873 RepID=A0A084W6Y7_ANOSI|nr:hypothetical protein ZHAS_00013946 [Anopheles sinensis]
MDAPSKTLLSRVVRRLGRYILDGSVAVASADWTVNPLPGDWRPAGGVVVRVRKAL